MQIKEKRNDCKNFIISNPQTTIVNIGLLLYLCLYTLILHNHLFDLMTTRTACFSAITLLIGFSLLVAWSLLRKDRRINELKPNAALKASYIALLVFGLCSVTACLLSEYPASALSGKDGRYMGTATLFMIGFSYWMLTRHVKVTKWMLRIFSIAVIVSVMIGYLHFVGIDPLHLMDYIPKTSQKNFISVLGNINVFSSFLCLSTPLFMMIYCCSNETFFEMMITVICFIGLFIANSDSGYIGFACSFFVVGLICLRHSVRALRKWIIELLAFCATAKMFSIVYRFGDGAVRGLSRLTRTFTFGYFPIIVILICAVLLLILKAKEPSDEFRKVLFWVLLGTGLFFVTAVLAALVYFTTIGSQYDLGSWSQYLRFNDEWGTGRGLIWRYMIKIFNQQPWYRKLFGTGADTIGIIMNEKYASELSRIGYNLVDNAHNEFLQIMVTQGVLGLLSYLAFSGIGVIYPLLSKNKKANLFQQAFAVSALCYLVQSVVNLHQPITTPLLVVFLAVAMSENMVQRAE